MATEKHLYPTEESAGNSLLEAANHLLGEATGRLRATHPETLASWCLPLLLREGAPLGSMAALSEKAHPCV